MTKKIDHAAERQIRRLHASGETPEGHVVCVECRLRAFPCPTVQALDGVLDDRFLELLLEGK